MLESVLDKKLEEQLGYYPNKSRDNSRNSYSKKTLKISLGEIDINAPRDRNNEFEPEIIRKH